MTTKKLWVPAMMAVIAFFPGHSPGQDASASKNHESTTIINTENGVYRWKSSGPITDFNIELRGRIELTDDDKDVKSISDDGYLEITKTVFGSKRSITIEPAGQGRLKKGYYEGRTQVAWEPSGRVWLGEILPEIIQSSTIGAESRVQRFFNKGGSPAVLNEIERLRSDHSKAHYAGLLMKHPVKSNDFPGIISRLSETIESDHYLAEFLSTHVALFFQSNESVAALFTATKELESDHYKTVVISRALQGKVANIENVRTILQAAGDMESDHYKTEVLSLLLRQNNLSDAIISEVIQNTNALESDHYRTVVLTKALSKTGISSASHKRIVESVKGLSSDHYITQVMMQMMEKKLSDDVVSELLEILPSLESDHYRTEILKMLIDRQDLNAAQFGKILQACGDMDSDHYKTIILKDAISGSVSDNILIQVLNITKALDSDHYITDVLVSVAPKVKIGSIELKNQYRQSAKNISSETYYGRALKAIEE